MEIEDLPVPDEKWFRENQDKIPINAPIVVEPEIKEHDIESLREESTTRELTYSLDSLLAQDFPQTEWVVDHLIPMQGLVALSGIPGSYKSFITEHLALCTATGSLLFGKFHTKRGNVLIIDKENQQRMMQQRFKLLGAINAMDVFFWKYDFFIEDEQQVKDICNEITKKSISLVIIDSLIRIYKGKNENASNDMAVVFRVLKSIQTAGAAIIFTHHHRKQSFLQKNTASENMRGSSDILASVDCHLAVDKLDNEIKITQTKLRQDMALKPFKLKLLSDPNHVEFNFCGEVEEEKEKVEQARVDILTALDEGEASRISLIDRFRGMYGSTAIDKALKSLVDDERVSVRIGIHGRKFYSKLTNNNLGLFEADS